jgi:hypothetical protein
MATAKQILDARAAGYSDADIAQHLGGNGYNKAKAGGYSDQEVINHFLSPGDQTLLGNIASSSGQGPVDELMGTSKDVGNMVKAGGAGIANIVPGAVKSAADLLALNPQQATQDFPGPSDLSQASEDIGNVEAGQPATSTAGKVGAGIGSFFTPNQIVLQGLGGALAKPIASGIGNAAAATMKGLSSVTPEIAGKIAGYFGAEPGAVASLAESPEAVSTAQNMKGAAEDTGAFLKGISKRGQAAAEAAKDALSDENEIEGAGDIAQKTLGKLTNDKYANQLATDKLSDIVKSIQTDPSESNIGQAIDDLDDLIKYNSKSAPDWSQNLQQVRGQLSNMLKTQNPAYKAGMEASAATRGPLSTLETNLGVKKGLPSDWTINALDKVTNPNALATQRALAALPGGAQLTGNVTNSVAKAALQQGLLGKLALMLAPNVNPVISGAVQAAPATANAVYQGLTQ